MREREEAQEEEAKAAAKAAYVADLMKEANLEGVDTLWDDMTVGDEEWAKLGQACNQHLCSVMVSCLSQNSHRKVTEQQSLNTAQQGLGPSTA